MGEIFIVSLMFHRNKQVWGNGVKQTVNCMVYFFVKLLYKVQVWYTRRNLQVDQKRNYTLCWDSSLGGFFEAGGTLSSDNVSFLSFTSPGSFLSFETFQSLRPSGSVVSSSKDPVPSTNCSYVDFSGKGRGPRSSIMSSLLRISLASNLSPT